MTLAGRCHAHNVGVSLLAACGLSAGWVAASEDEYVQLAVDAASDIPVGHLCTCSLVCDAFLQPTWLVSSLSINTARQRRKPPSVLDLPTAV
jgi:hypothetical protein